MSLYIGNISPQVHKEELERVFQRFGRCTVQVKEGYGFAVYGIRAQAETALRQLRGKRICGAILTLSWSNKQPQPLQSATRDGRIHKVHGGRGFVRRGGGHFPDRPRFNGFRDHQYNQRQLDDGGRRLDSAERHIESETLTHDQERQGDQSHRENVRDSGNSIDRNGLRASRWDDEGNKGYSENEMEFERYEPDHESEDKAERNQMTDSQGGKEIGGDETRTEQIGELGRNHSSSLRENESSCSMSGSLGHNMPGCPRQDASGNKILENPRNRGRTDMEYIDSRPRARMFSRNGAPDEPYGSSSKDSGFGIKKLAQGGDQLTTVHGKELGQKREIENEIATTSHQHYGKRAKKSVPSSHKYHRHFSRRSTSVSTSSASSSLYRSKSMSSSSYSPRSSRKSDRIRSETQNARSFKPRSRSNSPASLSLSVSHHQPAVSSRPPNKPEIDLNGPMIDIDDSVEINNEAKTDHMIPSDANTQYSSRPIEHLRKEGESLQTPPPGVEGVKLMSAPILSTSCHHSDYSISPDELSHVMKHYNLECSVEGQDLSTEEYFGCSRLWPWGIIYYRRLKKGAVSTENYARRLAQNREYGISDRYVRSSSGWGEPADRR